jgi:hypothetical protein
MSSPALHIIIIIIIIIIVYFHKEIMTYTLLLTHFQVTQFQTYSIKKK